MKLGNELKNEKGCSFNYYCFGVHSKNTILTLKRKTRWIHPNVRRQAQMLKFWNSVLKLANLHLLECFLNKTNIKGVRIISVV